MKDFNLLESNTALLSDAGKGNLLPASEMGDINGGIGVSSKLREGVGTAQFGKLNSSLPDGKAILSDDTLQVLTDLAQPNGGFKTQSVVTGSFTTGNALTATVIKGSSADALLGDMKAQPIVGTTSQDAITGATGSNYTVRAKELWRDKTTDFDVRDLAVSLQQEGANATQIAQAFKTGLGFQVETIADALDDGTTFSYPNIAEALWKSGHKLDTRKLADLLWDEGATEVEIGRSLKQLNFGLTTIADALDDGVTTTNGTGLNYTSIATGLWKSGHKLGTRQLADLLWDEGASQSEIGQALHYAVGRNPAQIASDVKNGVTKSDGQPLNYTSVATAVWKSGHQLTTRQLADLLWDTGASQAEIGQALRAVVGRTPAQIASDVKYGVTKSDGKALNYTSVATAVWKSGHQLTTRQLADLLWDAGASQSEIGGALKALDFGLTTIADAVDDGVTKSNGQTLNYTDTAIALWNSGHKITARQLADLLWDEGASQSEIGQALKSLGLGLTTIADAVDDGVTKSDGKTLNYTSVATALWNSGHKINPRQLADLLWDEGASPAEIGKALKFVGLGLTTIADAVDDGVTKRDGKKLNYTSVAKALWESGHKLTTRQLADLLWDEGASQIEIGRALKQLNFGLTTIADAVDDGVTKSNGQTLNYTDTAIALWNSGHKLNTRQLADLLWDEGASQGQVAQALNYAVGRNLSQIASDLKYGVTQRNGNRLNYRSVAKGLWESGLRVNHRDIARELQTLGATSTENAQVLRLQVGASLAGIADALDDGATYGYTDIARGLWNSGHGINSDQLVSLLRYEGAGYNATVDGLKKTGHSSWNAHALVWKGSVRDAFNQTAQRIAPVTNYFEKIYEDNKSTLKVIATPIVIGIESAKTVAKSIESGDVGPIVDVLKRIPVVGTAVGAVEGIVNALEGDEKGVLKSAIDSALAFYGGSNVITPKVVDFVVDIFWELKDNDFQGAISETLNNLGLEKTVSDIFVSVAWSMEQAGGWQNAVNVALSKVGFENPKELVEIAWEMVENDYQGALKATLDFVGVESLGLSQAQANTFVDMAVSIREGNYNKTADALIALSGKDAQQLAQQDWVKALRDGNSANDRQAVQSGLSELGFEQASQWADTLWAIKDGQYLDALSDVFTLGEFEDAQAWLSIIDDIKGQDYLDALATAFDLADFKDGQALAEAAIAVKNGNLLDAFYESFDLVEGGSDLKDAFQALKAFDLQDFINSMISAAPIFIKLL